MSARLLNIWLLLAALLAVLAACLLGSTPMPIERVLAAVLGQSNTADAIVIWQIRLPRALVAFVVGACLGASGRRLEITILWCEVSFHPLLL